MNPAQLDLEGLVSVHRLLMGAAFLFLCLLFAWRMSKPSPAFSKDPEGTIKKVLLTSGFDGWFIMVFAAPSLLFSILFLSLDGTLVSAALVGAGLVTFKGRRLIQARVSRGMRLLGYSQLITLAAMLAYFAYAMTSGGMLSGLSPSPEERQALAALQGAGFDPVAMRKLSEALSSLIYLTLMVAVFMGNGGLFAYYYRRGLVLIPYLDRRAQPPRLPGWKPGMPPSQPEKR